MRFRPIGLLLSGVVVASSACSMDATAPSSLAAPESVAPARGGRDGSAPATSTSDLFAGANARTYVVTINPQRRNVLRFGAHTLEIPAKAICASESGYGLASFGDDCRHRKTPVTITAVVRATNTGVPRIDLMPELRFSPKRSVTLSLHVADLTPAMSEARILYCPTATMAGCVDEARLDPSLETHVDYRESTLFRRIKHFSGYFIEW
jgi:hypothetical protein